MKYDMTIERAREVVERYSSALSEVQREYQARRVASWVAMDKSPEKGPRSAAAQAHVALMREENQTFRSRVADIYELYPSAYALVEQAAAADARDRRADTLSLVERIAYGD